MKVSTFLCWTLASILVTSSPAMAREPPPDCEGIAGKQVAWIVGTIVSIDRQTTRCTISAATEGAIGTDPRACVLAGATTCTLPVELRMDDVVVGGVGTSCFKPGVYTAEFCGVRCDKAMFSPGTLVNLHIERFLPRLKLRVQKVWWGGSRLQHTLMEGPVFATHPDELVVGASMEFVVSDKGQLTVVEPHCGYEATKANESSELDEAPGYADDQGADAGVIERNQTSHPGCTRCDSNSQTRMAPPFVGILVLAILFRRRKSSEL